VLRLSFASFASAPGQPGGDPKAQCSFCLREVAALRRLVVAPAASICDACVDRAVRALREHRAKGWRPWWDIRPPPRPADEPGAHPYRAGAEATCSFCGDSGVEDTILAEHARICPPCVRLALDVFREVAPQRVMQSVRRGRRFRS